MHCLPPHFVKNQNISTRIILNWDSMYCIHCAVSEPRPRRCSTVASRCEAVLRCAPARTSTKYFSEINQFLSPLKTLKSFLRLFYGKHTQIKCSAESRRGRGREGEKNTAQGIGSSFGKFLLVQPMSADANCTEMEKWMDKYSWIMNESRIFFSCCCYALRRGVARWPACGSSILFKVHRSWLMGQG